MYTAVITLRPKPAHNVTDSSPPLTYTSEHLIFDCLAPTPDEVEPRHRARSAAGDGGERRLQQDDAAHAGGEPESQRAAALWPRGPGRATSRRCALRGQGVDGVPYHCRRQVSVFLCTVTYVPLHFVLHFVLHFDEYC